MLGAILVPFQCEDLPPGLARRRAAPTPRNPEHRPAGPANSTRSFRTPEWIASWGTPRAGWRDAPGKSPATLRCLPNCRPCRGAREQSFPRRIPQGSRTSGGFGATTRISLPARTHAERLCAAERAGGSCPVCETALRVGPSALEFRIPLAIRHLSLMSLDVKTAQRLSCWQWLCPQTPKCRHGESQSTTLRWGQTSLSPPVSNQSAVESRLHRLLVGQAPY